jgi:flagellar hook-basal body complex protein FliE
MKVSLGTAAAAYANAARALGAAEPGGEAQGAQAALTGGFQQALQSAATQSAEALKAGEAVSMEAIAGKAQLSEVVTAVTNAEVTLQTVVAVRDKVIQAYQEILRMPI